MRALILAGGEGSRLRPLTHTNAKQLIPIAGTPILFHALEAIRDAGITEVGIVIGQTGDEIRAAVGDGSTWGLSVSYIPQEAPLGLAHAVMTARDFVAGQPFLMYLGDNVLLEGLSGSSKSSSGRDRMRRSSSRACRSPSASASRCSRAIGWCGSSRSPRRT